jgi:hypothetical protein
MMTWANQHADATYVLAYTSLQPLSSALCVLCVIHLTDNRYNLQEPGWNLLGGVGIAIGLLCVMRAQAQENLRARDGTLQSRSPRGSGEVVDGCADFEYERLAEGLPRPKNPPVVAGTDTSIDIFTSRAE